MLKKIALVAGSVLFAANLMAATPVAKAPHVLLETTNGQIEIELDPVKAPISTKNFLAYVDSGFYTNTIFHRVIPGFMVQGGGFTQAMTQKPTKDPIKNEASNGLHNVRGTLSMARTNDPNSATSQFFINVADNAFLDPGRDAGYAVFAKVVKGMDVVDVIVNSQTTTKQGMQNVPIDPVYIKSAKRID
jgi:peptidyl-prolyl cis-trans isomerase A (cyclophilin A)